MSVLRRGDPSLTIGMVHFAPLVGREGAPTRDTVLTKARQDLDALLAGGIPALMFENMYDFPHTERLDEPRREQFRDLLRALTISLRVPFGLSVLWNDYPTAFALAVEFGARWVRVPVFVDSVETTYGIFRADPAVVLVERTRAGASDVAIIADIQVKHARMLEPRPLPDSARAAEEAGADAVIVTGEWTGEPPTAPAVASVRAATRLSVLVGSGMTAENVWDFLPHMDGCIVGTSLKDAEPLPRDTHRLRAPWQVPVSVEKVRAFLTAMTGGAS